MSKDISKSLAGIYIEINQDISFWQERGTDNYSRPPNLWGKYIKKFHTIH